MPPRIETLQRLGALSLGSRPALTIPKIPLMPLVQTANVSERTRERERRRKQDRYGYAQAQQRKNANLERRKELQVERDILFGEPIWGRKTPFIESLESVAETGTIITTATAESSPEGEEGERGGATLRSHYVTDADIEDVAQRAYLLNQPVVGKVSAQLASAHSSGQSSVPAEIAAHKHDEKHARAVEALRRITSLTNAGKRDRYHINVQRIVDEFGRHNTDGVVRPKPLPRIPNTVVPAPRAGPDTGSSEVQIAILTTKIRSLAQALATGKGYKDVHNKRNLRLLLHRRQRLLRYMEKREKGSGRWTNMIEKLGLTQAMWHGQIELTKERIQLPKELQETQEEPTESGKKPIKSR